MGMVKARGAGMNLLPFWWDHSGDAEKTVGDVRRPAGSQSRQQRCPHGILNDSQEVVS